MMVARDPGDAKLASTRLLDYPVACFNIGGEPRCCLPLILNSILDNITLQSINMSCDILQIYCSTCSEDQMAALKAAAVIPGTACQCGLITKSDAERLITLLLDRDPPKASANGFKALASPFSFKVEHSCFGDCVGIVLPEAYTSVGAKCIECLQCSGLFCPKKFVCHSHGMKNRVCHWGFDSDNWRSYLRLCDEYSGAEKDKLQLKLDNFKARYAPGAANGKRKLGVGRKPSNFLQRLLNSIFI